MKNEKGIEEDFFQNSVPFRRMSVQQNKEYFETSYKHGRRVVHNICSSETRSKMCV